MYEKKHKHTLIKRFMLKPLLRPLLRKLFHSLHAYILRYAYVDYAYIEVFLSFLGLNSICKFQSILQLHM